MAVCAPTEKSGNYTLRMRQGLPPNLRASAVPRWSHRDPVEGGNPFAPTDPRHGTWDTATRAARAALRHGNARVAATAEVTLDPDIYKAQLLDLAAARFDVWARRGRAVVSTDVALQDYDRWLADYVANWLRYVGETCPLVGGEDELRTRLNRRAAHWVAETRNALAL